MATFLRPLARIDLGAWGLSGSHAADGTSVNTFVSAFNLLAPHPTNLGAASATASSDFVKIQSSRSGGLRRPFWCNTPTAVTPSVLTARASALYPKAA